MKQDFLNYIQETFNFSPSEMENFSASLSQPLKKTIRVNTNKISVEDFKKLAQKKSLPLTRGESEGGWILGETPLGKNMFYIDRPDTTLPLGHTLEHIAGYFYVQELAASSSPYYLSDDCIDTEHYKILDMSASPGGKTTQLAEYYPNSTIIANEIDKKRTKQLFENIDRMGASNVYVTNYDGRFFANLPETFDKILLDAPCSGEGTAYKTDDALKYWNLKNIKRIAKLQSQLLESALITLKVGGELVYSTCTLNRLENEDIIEKLQKKYGDAFEIIPPPNPLLSKEGETNPKLGMSGGGIRHWPHTTQTGGFFVARLKKTKAIPQEKAQKKLQRNTQGFEKLSNTSEYIVTDFLRENFGLTLPGKFFTYRDEIYYSREYDEQVWENFFLYQTGVKIGQLENGSFVPNFFCGTNFGIFEKKSFKVDEKNLHALLSGKELPSDMSDGYYQVSHDTIPAGMIRVKGAMMKSLLDTNRVRK